MEARGLFDKPELGNRRGLETRRALPGHCPGLCHAPAFPTGRNLRRQGHRRPEARVWRASPGPSLKRWMRAPDWARGLSAEFEKAGHPLFKPLGQDYLGLAFFICIRPNGVKAMAQVQDELFPPFVFGLGDDHIVTLLTSPVVLLPHQSGSDPLPAVRRMNRPKPAIKSPAIVPFITDFEPDNFSFVKSHYDQRIGLPRKLPGEEVFFSSKDLAIKLLYARNNFRWWHSLAGLKLHVAPPLRLL